MDNHHVYISDSRASCGILELSDFKSDVRKVLYALATHLYHPARGTPAAFVLWSDVFGLDGALSNGQALYQYVIEKFGCKYLQATAPHENPKTGNPIQVYLWSIPHEQFRQWYKDERVERAKRI